MKSFQFKGVKFLLFVLLAYVILLALEYDKTLVALQECVEILVNLVPIFVLIIVITGVINYLLKPKQILKHFGKESGSKGVFYALIGGIISHGPMYAWYGMLSDLRAHGVKDALIIIFLYARAVKLPLLPFMIDLFGVLFTVTMTLYILIAAMLQGRLMGAIAPKL
jgi:uncharacterized membrane protein YraQ (UPF0718 family)